ncbi:MAG: hypothetical protein WCK32_06925 [Chlorobiaceae bacterium]
MDKDKEQRPSSTDETSQGSPVSSGQGSLFPDEELLAPRIAIVTKSIDGIQAESREYLKENQPHVFKTGEEADIVLEFPKELLQWITIKGVQFYWDSEKKIALPIIPEVLLTGDSARFRIIDGVLYQIADFDQAGNLSPDAKGLKTFIREDDLLENGIPEAEGDGALNLLIEKLKEGKGTDALQQLKSIIPIKAVIPNSKIVNKLGLLCGRAGRDKRSKRNDSVVKGQTVNRGTRKSLETFPNP